MKEFFVKIFQTKIIESILVLIISLILYKVIKLFIDKGLKKGTEKKILDKKKRTYIKLTDNILKYAFFIVAVLMIMQINGVNVSSLLAGVGIAGAVVGLALQDALKDIIMGANILTDDFFSVGDVIEYGDIQGKVISFGLKATKIQDIKTGDIVSITNKKIESIVNVSSELYVDVPAPYEKTVKEMEKVITTIIDKIKLDENIQQCEYLGLKSFEDSEILYLIKIICKPELKLKMKRMALRNIKLTFEENNIEIPFTQIDVHNC